MGLWLSVDMAFPSGTPSYTGFTSSHTLSQDSHAAQHNQEQADIIALANKVGTGTSTPIAGSVLRGNGTGTSIWGDVDQTTDVTGILPQANGGTGTTAATGTGAAVYASSPTIATATLTNPTISAGGSWSGSPTISTPTIASFTNAQHNHSNAAGGGTLTGFNVLVAASVKSAQLLFGLIKNRQGGTAGDASWQSQGTTNVDTSAKDVFIQAGTILVDSTDKLVTFPTAYNQVPVVFANSTTAVSNNVFVIPNSITTTGFNARCLDGAGVKNTENINWLAIGQ